MDKYKQVLAERRVVGSPDECWLWLGTTAGHYGQVQLGPLSNRDSWYAHRLAFYVEHAFLPPHVHHLCGVKLCVNPEHLEGMSLVAHQRVHHEKATCGRGHDWSVPENVYVRPDTGKRTCRACQRVRQRARARLG